MVGNYAYVADWDAGLKIIDISNPSSPSLVGTCNTLGAAREVVVVGNYAYVANYNLGLQIIDVSSPSNPSLVRTYATTGDAHSIFVVGDYAYVADAYVAGAGLQIIDVSNPSSPNLMGAYNTPSSNALGVFVVGDYAYVADDVSGLHVIEGIGEGVQLSGTPAISDVGFLNLKAIASDGVGEVSTAFSIDVQNTAPVISAVPKMGTEDSVLTFTEADFASKFNDTNGNSLAKIQVVSLPTNGTLDFLGMPVLLDQEIVTANLSNLTFGPDSNWNGNTSFAWKGYDGFEYSLMPADVNINIAAVQDAPTVTDVPKLGTENTVLTFSAMDFTGHFGDVDGDGLTKIQITSLPLSSAGVLKFSGVAVVLDQEIIVGELGNLTFEPNTDWDGNTSFAWKGHDSVEYSAASANVNIQIDNVNRLPVISDVVKSGKKNTPLSFSSADFTDVFQDADGENMAQIQVVTLPNNGNLKLSTVGSVLEGQVIATNDINELVFDPDKDFVGTTGFSWKGFDGLQYSSTAKDVTIEIQDDWFNTWWGKDLVVPVAATAATAVVGIPCAIATYILREPIGKCCKSCCKSCKGSCKSCCKKKKKSSSETELVDLEKKVEDKV